MSFVEILALVYLLLFSIYHLFTGIVSVFFSEFALKFYKKIYGFEPKETKLLKMNLKPWGNLALNLGVIGFIIFFNIDRYFLILFAFAFLLIIRIWYRITYRDYMKSELKISSFNNWKLIIIQLVGAVLFILYGISYM